MKRPFPEFLCFGSTLRTGVFLPICMMRLSPPMHKGKKH